MRERELTWCALLISAGVFAVISLAPPSDAHIAAATEFDRTYRAVCAEESNGRADAFNEDEGAVGIAQIRAICRDDVNRICRLVGDPRRWTVADCYDPAKSREMYVIYVVWYGCRYYRLTGRSAGPEIWARCWNGGPDGWQKPSTLDYWRRVQRRMP